MKTAYLILAHKNPSQLKQLVERLNSKSTDFFIHIDRAANIEPFRRQLGDYDNVFWVDREKGQWGGLGIVKATLNCLKKALSEVREATHFILLSGQDYPLKSTSKINEFLSHKKNHSYIEFEPLPNNQLRHNGRDRIECYSITLFGKRLTATPFRWKPEFNLKGQILNALMQMMFSFRKKRKHPKAIDPYYGSQWWILSKTVAQFIIEFLNKHPEYVEYHEHSLLPDEIFFQSIVGSADKANKFPNQEIHNCNQHFIEWEHGSSHPKVLDTGDFNKLRISNKLFARKFSPELSKNLISLLDEQT